MLGSGSFALSLATGHIPTDTDAVVVFLLGGEKSTQAKDIKKAHIYWVDYTSTEGGS